MKCASSQQQYYSILPLFFWEYAYGYTFWQKNPRTVVPPLQHYKPIAGKASDLGRLKHYLGREQVQLIVERF